MNNTVYKPTLHCEGLAFDLLLESETEFDRAKFKVGTIEHAVCQQGIVIYEPALVDRAIADAEICQSRAGAHFPLLETAIFLVAARAYSTRPAACFYVNSS